MTRAVLAAVVFCCAARAGDLEVWNTTELPIARAGRFEWTAAGTLRLRHHLSSAYDDRLGGWMRVAVTPRLALRGGYIHRWMHLRPEDRPYGGASFIVAAHPVRLEWSGLYERHIVPGRDYNEYRTKLDLERTRSRASPVLWYEAYFHEDGFFKTRALAGVRLNWEGMARLELGYQFESLKASGGGWAPRHVLRTTLHIARPVFGGR